MFWKQIEGLGRWAVQFAANDHVNFGVIAAGGCHWIGPREPIQLAHGDFLLLTAPGAFTFGSSPGVTPVEGCAALRAGAGQVLSIGAGEPTTRILAGHFELESSNRALLLGLLPRFVHLRAAEPCTARIRTVLDLLGDEALAGRDGAPLILERLTEIMLVEVIRGYYPATDDRPGGLLGGLADPPVAAALHALHADVRRPWTVASLAAVAHVSRSTFAERFTQSVGTTPITYLTDWRMALAKAAISRGDRSLAQIADAVGYGSSSAFSTAFRRSVGMPPARYAVTHADRFPLRVPETPTGPS